MKKLENEKLIITKKSSGLIFIYFNPRNWHTNQSEYKRVQGKTAFDCDKYISIYPPGYENPIKVEDEPHPDTGKITDTIIHEDEWYTKQEGLPIVFNRIFQ